MSDYETCRFIKECLELYDEMPEQQKQSDCERYNDFLEGLERNEDENIFRR